VLVRGAGVRDGAQPVIVTSSWIGPDGNQSPSHLERVLGARLDAVQGSAVVVVAEFGVRAV
jgi:hypothetical protein